MSADSTKHHKEVRIVVERLTDSAIQEWTARGHVLINDQDKMSADSTKHHKEVRIVVERLTDSAIQEWTARGHVLINDQGHNSYLTDVQGNSSNEKERDSLGEPIDNGFPIKVCSSRLLFEKCGSTRIEEIIISEDAASTMEFPIRVCSSRLLYENYGSTTIDVIEIMDTEGEIPSPDEAGGSKEEENKPVKEEKENPIEKQDRLE